jgi:two-component system chemotaxis sensor kinase CheA
MDVVRENIEAIGGSISLSSTLGQGTCFSMKIPLTLAIAPAHRASGKSSFLLCRR